MKPNVTPQPIPVTAQTLEERRDTRQSPERHLRDDPLNRNTGPEKPILPVSQSAQSQPQGSAGSNQFSRMQQHAQARHQQQQRDRILQQQQQQQTQQQRQQEKSGLGGWGFFGSIGGG